MLFTGVDRAIFGATFARKLEGAGLPVPLSSINRFVESIGAAGPVAKRDLYWIGRVSLLSDIRHLEIYNQVFAAVFDITLEEMKGGPRRGATPATLPTGDDAFVSLRVPDADHNSQGGGLPWATLPSVVEDDDDENDEEAQTGVPERLPSFLEAELDTPFDLLDAEQLVAVEAALDDALKRWPSRPSRRRRQWSSGPHVQLRATLRSSLRTGGEPVHLKRAKNRHRSRRVVMLVDVSGSMQSFVRPYLHLTRALIKTGDNTVGAEVFAFGTRLTRITTALKHRSPTEAIDQASEQVVDRFGGTRLAHSIRSLLTHRTWGSYVRGAVVLIASDGWDTDPPEDLANQMIKLSRRANKVIWLNPRSANQEFEPLVASMAAALPHCTEFLPGHSLGAMPDVISAICE